jgi:UDP-N-acetylmuramate dehydrogenase
VLPADQMTFSYRSVPQFQEKPLLGCKLKLRHADEAGLRKIRLHQLAERAAKQPREYPSCGSVFKRPPNHYVGKMVQELELKGFRYGDAMISEKHGGFIANLGNAKATHIKYIIEKVQDDVYTHFGVHLEPEVRFVGF